MTVFFCGTKIQQTILFATFLIKLFTIDFQMIKTKTNHQDITHQSSGRIYRKTEPFEGNHTYTTEPYLFNPQTYKRVNLQASKPLSL